MGIEELIGATAKRDLEVMQQRVKEKKGTPWQMATFGPLGAFLVKEPGTKQTNTLIDSLNEVLSRLKPQDPNTGPPLPSGLDISWPGFFSRGIKRMTTQGLSAPYKTIKEKGLLEEIKEEIGWITGVRPGKSKS